MYLYISKRGNNDCTLTCKEETEGVLYEDTLFFFVPRL